MFGNFSFLLFSSRDLNTAPGQINEKIYIALEAALYKSSSSENAIEELRSIKTQIGEQKWQNLLNAQVVHPGLSTLFTYPLVANEFLLRFIKKPEDWEAMKSILPQKRFEAIQELYNFNQKNML